MSSLTMLTKWVNILSPIIQIGSKNEHLTNYNSNQPSELQPPILMVKPCMIDI